MAKANISLLLYNKNVKYMCDVFFSRLFCLPFYEKCKKYAGMFILHAYVNALCDSCGEYDKYFADDFTY